MMAAEDQLPMEEQLMEGKEKDWKDLPNPIDSILHIVFWHFRCAGSRIVLVWVCQGKLVPSPKGVSPPWELGK